MMKYVLSEDLRLIVGKKIMFRGWGSVAYYVKRIGTPIRYNHELKSKWLDMGIKPFDYIYNVEDIKSDIRKIDISELHAFVDINGIEEYYPLKSFDIDVVKEIRKCKLDLLVEK